MTEYLKGYIQGYDDCLADIQAWIGDDKELQTFKRFTQARREQLRDWDKDKGEEKHDI